MEHAIIQQKIYIMRGHRIMLDFDLAILYQTETKYIKRAVKRNFTRFPSDFMFELNKEELDNLRCQIGTSSWGGSRYPPFAFTEQGVAMISSVLNNEKAIQVNIAIMRAFVELRHFTLNYKDLTEKIAELEQKYDKNFEDVNEVLKWLGEENQQRFDEIKNLHVEKDTQIEWQKNRNRIGF
jgi:phage regulator Rha-like protein